MSEKLERLWLYCIYVVNVADGQGNLSSALTQEKLAESLPSFANDDTDWFHMYTN